MPQYKADVLACGVCAEKFNTLAVSRLRKEHQKHHCRMCGRVVCHACAATLLFYDVSGKRQRTCDECIRHGGPPPSRLASEANQKSILTLVQEQKAAYDAAKAGEGAAAKKSGLPPGMAKDKTSAVAAWADWGAVPEAKLKPLTDQDKANGIDLKFTVYLPADAAAGDTVEVTLPAPDSAAKGGKQADAAAAGSKGGQALARSVVCVVGPDGTVDRKNPDQPKLPVEVGFGVDGIAFALPPEQVRRARCRTTTKYTRLG